MDDNSLPLVSVVTPVYNGEEYLAECIESVLAQTYDNWEYIIVDNCSTDDSLQIAKDYAKRDARIRIHDNSEFLTLAQNWNHALRQISAQSEYCKVVHADDWIYPECLAKMVEVAEDNPNVGIVGAYRLEGDGVKPYGPKYPSNVVSGRDIGRIYLIQEIQIFGNPTSTLIRSDLIRSRDPYYRGSTISLDVEACLDLLKTSDYGFVYQVLTFSRIHDRSVTSSVKDLKALHLGRFLNFMKYGPIYLSRHEYSKYIKQRTGTYYEMLLHVLFRHDRRKVWVYHKSGLEEPGYTLSLLALVKALFSIVIDRALNPKRTIQRKLRRFRRSKGLRPGSD